MKAHARYPDTPLGRMATSYERHLLAENKSKATIITYMGAIHGLNTHMVESGETPSLENITRDHIEAFVSDLLRSRKASTAHNRFRGLKTFFLWLVDEEELTVSPMRRMRAPILPDSPTPVVATADIQALLDVCSGTGFEDRRDAAIIRLLLDTGMRLGELLGLKVEDIDLVQGTACVLGKGRRLRVCSFGSRTTMALDRYLRARAKCR